MSDSLFKSGPATIGVVNWHLGRCGSSVLGSLLAQQGEIQYENEIFSRYMPRRRGDAPLPSMEEVLQSTQTSCHKRVQLIEIKYLTAQNLGLYNNRQTIDDWLQVLSRFNFKHHLVLHRRNGLRRIISHLMAQRSGVYVLKSEAAKPSSLEKPQLTINYHAISEGFETHSLLEWLDLYEESHERAIECLERWREEYAWPALCHLSYEDHIESSPLIGYQHVCDHLRLTARPANIQHQKINPEPLESLISNYDEVADQLAGTRHAWMLNS